jgi:hypothetical protein
LSVTCDRSVVFSTNKTDCHDIAESDIKHQKPNQTLLRYCHDDIAMRNPFLQSKSTIVIEHDIFFVLNINIYRSRTNFITECYIEYTLPWTGFEMTTLVVIGTDCIGSCKSNYHTITTMMAPILAKVKPEMWDVMRSRFRAKHINDIIFIKVTSVTETYPGVKHPSSYWVLILMLIWIKL